MPNWNTDSLLTQVVTYLFSSELFLSAASGSPYYVPASGSSFVASGAKTISAKFGNLRARAVDNSNTQSSNVQFTTAYIQVSGIHFTSYSHTGSVKESLLVLQAVEQNVCVRHSKLK